MRRIELDCFQKTAIWGTCRVDRWFKWVSCDIRKITPSPFFMLILTEIYLVRNQTKRPIWSGTVSATKIVQWNNKRSGGKLNERVMTVNGCCHEHRPIVMLRDYRNPQSIEARNGNAKLAITWSLNAEQLKCNSLPHFGFQCLRADNWIHKIILKPHWSLAKMQSEKKTPIESRLEFGAFHPFAHY